MKNPNLPYRITEYINGHFKEDFLFEVKDVRKVKNRWFYTVEVSKDNYIQTLKFNDKGEVISGDTEEAFPPDIHEEPGFEDIPE
jgi:hypothetical protein